MKHKSWLCIILGFLLLGMVLLLMLRRTSESSYGEVSITSTVPLITRTAAASTKPLVTTTVQTSLLIIPEWDDLPTVTPLAPGEPIISSNAQVMRAAPTATPGVPPTMTPLPTPTPTVAAEPTPTPMSVIGYDNVPMVAIPGGEFIVGCSYDDAYRRSVAWRQAHPKSYPPDFTNESPQLIVNLSGFSIDKYPVTNQRYQSCVNAEICVPIEIKLSEDYTASANEYPVQGVSWYDAVTYCNWVGKRLPTEAEWEKAARGNTGRLYPWGNAWNQDFVSFTLSPVGITVDGASPYGIHDMLGHGGEWTMDRYQYYPGNSSEPSTKDQDYLNVAYVFRGYIDTIEPQLYWVTNRRWALPEQSVGIGFRCVRGAEPPPVLEDVTIRINVSSPPEPVEEVDLGHMAYIPSGEFIMGYQTPYIYAEGITPRTNATPAHIVDLDGFYIDKYKITNREYVDFLNVLGVHTLTCDGYNCASVRYSSDPPDPDIPIFVDNGLYDVDSGFEDFPVHNVSWQGAMAYCNWLGKRLPTEAEWEKAARGTDGRIYPWGNEWGNPQRIPHGSYPVGSQLDNVSPYGVFDVLGNELEWVQDWYAKDYYSYSPPRNPTGPSTGEIKVRRALGGPVFGVPDRFASYASSYASFRCVYAPE